ncbi:MAG: hypothetical protein R2911_45830 [Caldilineaceae bacterium]
MSSQTGSYYAYLLRIWREQHKEQTVWRASLEDAQGGQIHGFGSLRELFDFLETQAMTNQEDSNKPERQEP